MIGVDIPLLNRRYKVMDKLGEGGMGAVYRAVDALNGQAVALKRVSTPPDQLQITQHEPTSSSYNMRLALAQEFRTLASLRHPHIISVLDYGFDDDGQPFFTMDLLDEPQTILEAGDDQPLSIQVNLLAQMLQAIAYLHRRGVLHRDLKPGNVLVSRGQVKVLDFGLSAGHDQPDETDTLVGTLTYIAPEVFMGAPPREAADLYAVGVMAYELLVGRHPFQYENVGQLINQVLTSSPDLSPLPGDGELAAIIGRLLAKAPEARYRDAYQVIDDLCASAGQTAPVESAAVRESFLQAARFVGREAELKTLEQALQDAVDGRGSAQLIGGESGVGKTRLLDELRVRALVRGVLVLRGQAVAEGGMAYQLWRDPLRRLTLASDLSDLDAGILKDLIPDIDALLGRAIPDAVELDGTASQQRLFGAIASLFQRQNQPILLLLEDLQWSTESLDVLRLLNGMASGLPLLIVGTYRHDERPSLPADLPGMKLLRLERLTAERIADLSVSMLGEQGSQPELLAFLQRETEGNVFFLVEVMRALAEEAGQLQRVGRASLPRRVAAGGMQAVIQRRLGRVPDDGRGLLYLAAITGRELDLAILHHLKGALNLDDWLTICANCAVLEFQEGSWRFGHDKLRQAALDGIEAERLPLLHRQVAEAIEAAYPQSPERAGALAQHWRSAGDVEKELYYAQQAGEYTLDSSAFSDAAAHFERALFLSEQCGVSESRRADLLLRLAEARKYLGDYAAARSQLEDALKLRQTAGDAAGVARALVELGDLVTQEGDYARAEKLCQDSLAVCRQIDDSRGIIRALDRLCMVRFYQGDYASATMLGEESLALSRATRDAKGFGSAINNLGLIAFTQGNYERAAEFFNQTLAIFRANGERRKAATALLNLGSAAGQRGDYDSANRYFEEALSIFKVVGERRGIAMTLDNLGVIAEFQANYSRALYYFEQSLALGRAIGNRRGVATTLLNLGNVSRAQGETEQARDFYRQALRQAQEIDAVPILLETLVGLCALNADAEQAGRWLGLALNHAAVSDATRQVAEPVLQKLKEKLPPETLDAQMESGKTLALNEVIREILA